MTDRYTKVEVVQRFTYLAALFNMQVASDNNEIGAWKLDHNNDEGGYVICQIGGKRHAVSYPFGHTRRHARQFCEWSFVLVDGMHAGAVIGITALTQRQRHYIDNDFLIKSLT